MDEQNQYPKRMGRGMLWLAAIALLLSLTMLFDRLQVEPGAQVETLGSGDAILVKIQRDRSGHYLARGEVNGTAVTFLLDTGATDVAIPQSLASKLDLERGPEISLNTANGVVRGYMTRLETVSVGGISLHNVRASVSPDSGTGPLLGMSFLGRLDWQQQDGELILRQRN